MQVDEIRGSARGLHAVCEILADCLRREIVWQARGAARFAEQGLHIGQLELPRNAFICKEHDQTARHGDLSVSAYAIVTAP